MKEEKKRMNKSGSVVTHAAEVRLALGIAEKYLVGFGDKIKPMTRFGPGDSLDLDVSIRGHSGKLVGRIQVKVHMFMKPVDEIIRTV